jgi:hypothetical protein
VTSTYICNGRLSRYRLRLGHQIGDGVSSQWSAKIRSRVVSLTVHAVEQPVRAHEQRSSAPRSSSGMATEARAGVSTPPYPPTYQHHVVDAGFQLRPAFEQQLPLLDLAARSAGEYSFLSVRLLPFLHRCATSHPVTTVTVWNTKRSPSKVTDWSAPNKSNAEYMHLGGGAKPE